MATSFEKAYKLGELGEEIAFKRLVNHPKISRVHDVRLSMRYQKIDVDFVVYDSTGRRKLNIEVKTDDAAGRYGNFFIENSLVYFDGTVQKGWLQISKAHKFVIYVPKNRTLYMFSAKDVKDYIQKYNPNLKSCGNDWNKKAYGYCVNIKDFCRKYNVSSCVVDDTKGVA